MADISLIFTSKATYSPSEIDGLLTSVLHDRMRRAARAVATVVKEGHEDRISTWNRKPSIEIEEDSGVSNGVFKARVVVTDSASSWWSASNFGKKTAPNGIRSRVPMPIARYGAKNNPDNGAKGSGTGRESKPSIFSYRVGPNREIRARNFIDSVFNQYKDSAIEAGEKELLG